MKLRSQAGLNGPAVSSWQYRTDKKTSEFRPSYYLSTTNSLLQTTGPRSKSSPIWSMCFEVNLKPATEAMSRYVLPWLWCSSLGIASDISCSDHMIKSLAAYALVYVTHNIPQHIITLDRISLFSLCLFTCSSLHIIVIAVSRSHNSRQVEEPA